MEVWSYMCEYVEDFTEDVKSKLVILNWTIVCCKLNSYLVYTVIFVSNKICFKKELAVYAHCKEAIIHNNASIIK